jgi:hypothetical protein
VIVDHINAIEADELMSDELALALVIEEDENGDPAEEENENEAAEKTGDLDVDGACVIVATTAQAQENDALEASTTVAPVRTVAPPAAVHPKTEGQKGHINLGEVDAAFETGDIVTLDALKQKGLVSQKIKRIKILADGELTKPLTVKAHSFSIQAIKMIELTGGKVIKLR